ncbi:glycosyltransferase family 2 protein [Paenibacillus fonticola]|uniref:glycosyltransferase family 2 protein n=1 Tax=Paenibacillus fonticola TaxID=379896 RepID=UPI00037059DA|nr:glycosyltransferase [Paenibacillus fonticola]
MPRKRRYASRRNRKTIVYKGPSGYVNNHPNPVVSIIIPAMNERATLADVLYQASRIHRCSETIVVANGSTDGTPEISAKLGARVITADKPLGHDVGRRVGAEAAKGQVLLFIDADMVIPAAELRPFVKAVLEGVDVALNDYSGPTGGREVHTVVLAKHSLNAMLGRSDLKGASLTAVPHAISRKAAAAIGFRTLEVPPVALAAAVLRGFKVQAVHSVQVGRINPAKYRGRQGDPLTSLIAGDHLDALHWLIYERGSRGGYSDLGRQRDKVR